MYPQLGIDFLDVSSGGSDKDQIVKPHTDYQIDLAAHIRAEIRHAGQKTLVGAVGLITVPQAASQIVEGSDTEDTSTSAFARADAVLLGRQFLREADWVYHAAKTLGVQVTAPKQLGRAI